MHVVATAGHVDHGKSTLVRALTGTDPDRLAEEHRRGLSIQLGYAWTVLREVGEVAFVDVPGHERFITTMLSGIGAVPAVLLVVAADDPWMPQAAEHLAALDALGVRHGVVAVTRSDLADPGATAGRAAREVAATSLRGAPVVPVSARTGQGLPELRAQLAAVLRRVPSPAPDADVRLWVDRRFTVRGAGTVVTGTLPAGTVRAGDSVECAGRLLRVRAVQTLGRSVTAAHGAARVAVNLAGDADDVAPGSVLLTPGAWTHTTAVDVRLVASPIAGQGPPPQRPLLHVGATAVEAHHRPLGGALARLVLSRPLPLRVGDRAILRDPGNRRLWGVTVLDPAPPPLRRRGAAQRRAGTLTSHDGTPDLAAELDRRGLVSLDLLRRLGVPTAGAEGVGVVTTGWALSRRRAHALAAQVQDLVAEHDRAAPLDPGLPVTAVAARLALPVPELVRAVVRPPLAVSGGRVVSGGRPEVPAEVRRAAEVLDQELAGAPFRAPTADRLRELGLPDRTLAAAARAGLVLRPAPGIVLGAGADTTAAARLAELPQPFTTSEARQRLDTTRRVVLPLLEYLDRRGMTRRLPDDRRRVTGRGTAEAG
ncbi:SelB C-terminal domain-containing protein [Georgenia sp. 10Sc9-8]|uniref:SelB C-terminal domain-containing protein n=1 Tax=Georgenia halotolerans TaxID=3028317 RepID=A0ABT5U0W2_9MICO|nr:SelB C-terminal domain-containing protein [Georgenia halotolerans]